MWAFFIPTQFRPHSPLAHVMNDMRWMFSYQIYIGCLFSASKYLDPAGLHDNLSFYNHYDVIEFVMGLHINYIIFFVGPKPWGLSYDMGGVVFLLEITLVYFHNVSVIILFLWMSFSKIKKSKVINEIFYLKFVKILYK